MSVRVHIDDDIIPAQLQDRMNAQLARIPDEDVKSVQLSSHNTTVGLVHVGRIVYQVDEDD